MVIGVAPLLVRNLDNLDILNQGMLFPEHLHSLLGHVLAAGLDHLFVADPLVDIAIGVLPAVVATVGKTPVIQALGGFRGQRVVALEQGPAANADLISAPM